MYVKTENGNVITYPYRPAMLVAENPNVSFPAEMSDELLAEFGVYPVIPSEKPVESVRKTISETNPVNTAEGWVQAWSTEDIPFEIKASETRQIRDQKLKATDWTVLQDSPFTDAQTADWVIYRQALRDITDHANFPYLEDADWPVSPE